MNDSEPERPRPKVQEDAASDENKRSSERAVPFWQHPLTLLVTGFVLTGIVGTFISARIQEHSTDQAEEVEHYQLSTKAVTDFSDALYLRYVRAGMVKSALQREAPLDEVKHRKDLYDDALVKQEGSAMSSLLLIREALKRQDYDEWEKIYESMMKPLLSNLDNSLTVATDEYLRQAKNGLARSKVDLSDFGSDYEDVRNCEYSLINGMFLTLSTKQYVNDSKKVIATQAEALDEAKDRCRSTRRTTHPQTVTGR